MIDFTNCRVLKKSYNGANGNKLCIEYNDERYMLKFSTKPKAITNLSYTNGCVSEYLSCHIFEMLGVPVQETILGTYNVNDKEKLVVACKDFTDIGIILQDFGSLKNQVIDSEHQGYGTELSDVLDAIDKQTAIDSVMVLERFWDMFVVDALLGNFDRHNGNWGFLYNQITDVLELAPVFDCGSCLYPQADEAMIIKILGNQDERNARIYTFPNSAIKENGKKISYYDFLMDTNDKNCQAAVLKIVPKVNLGKIHDLVEQTEYIEPLQKTFYEVMITERYEKILIPVWKRMQDMK